MVRTYVPVGGWRQPPAYSEEDLKAALSLVADGMALQAAARQMNIPRRTLRNHFIGERKTTVVGRRTALLPEEERSIAQHVAALGDSGYAFDTYELRLFVKSFLDRAGRSVSQFKDNMPGIEWARSFMKRHAKLVCPRMCQNISRSRAAVSVDTVTKYFENLEVTLAGAPPSNIVNYDETNLTDDAKSKVMLYRRGIKHPERVMNVSKSSVSVMFAIAASGDILPPYVVYKAEHLMNSWVLGGPVGTRYNRTKSGWFDGHCFSDWVATIAIPYFQSLDNDLPRVLIGDNLSSHITSETLQLCEENNIRFVFLPPNSTHLLQPLDVAVYGPLKKAWRKVLSSWKANAGKHYTVMQKQWFPVLLQELLEAMDNRPELAKAGFRGTGIYPFNADHVLRKLTHEEVKPAYDLVSEVVLDRLRDLREAAKLPAGGGRGRSKRISVEPGRSVGLADLQAGPSTSSGGPSTSGGASTSTAGNPGRKRKARVQDPEDSSSDDDDIDSPAATAYISTDDEDEGLSRQQVELAVLSPDDEEEDNDEEEDKSEVNEDTASGVIKDEPESKEKEVSEFNIGDYVLVKFHVRKVDVHYVGKIDKVLQENVDTKTAFLIQYFRRELDSPSSVDGGDLYVFKDPAEKDLSATFQNEIVKKLPLPSCIKGKMHFPKTLFGTEIVR